MIVVIADDLTSAAEIAGICGHYGLSAHLSIGIAETVTRKDLDVLVIATDTRQMSVTDAVTATRQIIGSLPSSAVLFKKTDSALRGHVTEELSALLHSTRYQRALYLPANPSKNRIIRAGIYYINGQPIGNTAFALDPEYPAWSSSVTERFPSLHRWPSQSPSSLYYADAVSIDDLRSIIEDTDEYVLLAGGADLFTIWLESLGHIPLPVSPPPAPSLNHTILICGSTQSKGHPGLERCEMPDAVYQGEAPASEWTGEALRVLRQHHRVMLCIPGSGRNDPSGAAYLRETTAEVVSSLTNTCPVEELLIEGGATAYSILSRIGCRSLLLEGELSPGVVSFHYDHTRIIMKPGSYAWPF